MHFLVTGGAGYIGSHLVRALLAREDEATIVDDFSTGHRWAIQGREVIEVDLRDLAGLRRTLAGRHFDGVFHFAAKSLVGESQAQPLLYWQNNVAGTANLLQVANDNGWGRVVFSSTAAVYGNPETPRITEAHPTQPINVYGETKLAVERLLRDVSGAGKVAACSLRYFNAAGAADDASLGEAHEPETHLIPNALRAASGNAPALTVFGDDYDTPDGTCLRDYIHVEDLADAHLLAMDHLAAGGGFAAYNLGSGAGYSVRQVLDVCEQVVGRPIPHSIGARRAGDPPVLVAATELAQDCLGWTPRRASLRAIVESAWAWEQKGRPAAGGLTRRA
ncbi:UDP-glucose 4-epimerase GalE [Pseudohaliea rubra]|uniref:UDP-glucose 4-epimerase n=1 Tax=Pseudohaliea rubra DSM 19751 TaxID=1265313 RepID=A0A095WYV0_9GAMM|nr:UDP-glucose 4-epimerase GalE [Pseudohaliea rubra]KGE03809.1 UDP-glucose 4-epimerase [Pseudohaliea rubra DSM 19751]